MASSWAAAAFDLVKAKKVAEAARLTTIIMVTPATFTSLVFAISDKVLLNKFNSPTNRYNFAVGILSVASYPDVF
jgi:hypothetical protein